MAQGVIYVAYGDTARDEARESMASLRQYHNWPVLVVGDKPIEGTDYREWPDKGAPGRWAKVNLDKLTPWEQTLFLDADTRVRGDLSIGFDLLANHDLIVVPSRPQHNEALRHLNDEERAATLDELYVDPLQLNTGVMWFKPSPIWDVWREEWLRWRDKDQGALLRALEGQPVAVALLGWPYNDLHGEVVEHRFGACGG